MKRLATAFVVAPLVFCGTEIQTRMSKKPTDEPLAEMDRGVRPLHDAATAPSKPAENVFGRKMPEDMKKRLHAQLAQGTEAEHQANRLLQAGKLRAAEAECRRAMTFSPRVDGKAWHMGKLQLLGYILLAQGRNQEALKCFTDDFQETRSTMSSLNVALAYCRLGNFKKARQFCPDEAIAELASPKRLEDWPGTRDIKALEASILLARGLDLAACADARGALPYLQAAGKLASKNWLIAYNTARALNRLSRRAEAVLYYRRAVKLGGDRVPDRARRRAGLSQ